jgi:hypothetical protein
MRCTGLENRSSGAVRFSLNKPESSPRLSPAQAPDWVLQTAQQIQALDYELHAAIRIISKGQMQPEHVPAFMSACVKRDRLMARIFTYLAEQTKRTAYHEIAARNGKP